MNYDVLFFIHVNRHDFGHYNLMRVFGNAYQMQQMFFFNPEQLELSFICQTSLQEETK